MDRFEFVAWLQIAGFIHHPTSYTAWLKLNHGNSIKLRITDVYIEISIRKTHSPNINARFSHHTFESARDHIVDLLNEG